MKCDYCGTSNQDDTNCTNCGASLSKDAPKTDFMKSEPFFYNGYLVVCIRDFMRDEFEVQFWLGKELQERICVSRLWYEQHVPEGCDPIQMFWDLFLLAKGEKEVLYWKDKNNKPYVMYEVRCIDERLSYVKVGDKLIEA